MDFIGDTQVKREEYYFGCRGQIKKLCTFHCIKSHSFTASDVAAVFRMGMVFLRQL